MSDKILEVKNLTKKFGDFTAVNNLSFEIGSGEILGVLGRNGAGKTTTIQMLLGVMDETRGEIAYFGKPFKKNRSEILKQINFSSTYISLPLLFTVEEVLNVFARLYEIPDRNKRINKLLEEFEIDGLRKEQVSSLSAGERTRLLLTKSFLNYPRIILLDEPTASLDPDIAVKVREFLKKEREEYNVSMLFTSHNMAEVEEICDRVIVLEKGKMIAEDTPDNLAKKISQCTLELLIIADAKKAVEVFKKNKYSFEENKSHFKIKIDEEKISDFLITLASENISYDEININKPSLEDYFLQVVGENKHD